MADTVIEIELVPGTTEVYATAAGGTGTATGSPYTASQIAGYLHSITVADAIVGRWYFGGGSAAGYVGYRIVEDLTDTAETFAMVDVDGRLIDVTPIDGDYTVTITIEDDSDDSAIEGAKVRMYRSGQSESKLTDSNGQAAFTLDAATWTVAVTAAGFDGDTNTLAVSADASQTYQLTASIGASAPGWIG